MRIPCSLVLSVVSLLSGSTVATAGVITITFGTGVNTFTMEFVEIGNPGNADDTAYGPEFTESPYLAGSVAYTYEMGKYEVSRDMITKYNSEFGTANSLAITLADMSSVGGNGADKPATGVTWNEAARFVNWLNTSTGGFAAYNFTTDGVNDHITPWTSTLDYDASNPYRSLRATYVLPSMDEWYKAAYYDPENDVYYDYPTGSNTAPTAVASGTTAGTAVYELQSGPADITLAGGLSPYGIMGLGGNVNEWEETATIRDNGTPEIYRLSNNPGANSRGNRGGNWRGLADPADPDGDLAWGMSTEARNGFFPENEHVDLGFRVVRLFPVPEPGSMALLLAGALVFGYRRLRK